MRTVLVVSLVCFSIMACNQDADEPITRSAIAVYKYKFSDCDIDESERVLLQAIRSLGVTAMALDERYAAVNPEGVLTILGETEHFSLEVNNFADRHVLSVEIHPYPKKDESKAIEFIGALDEQIGRYLRCATRLLQRE
ncbi:MAG: hypothetical protein AAFY56_20330 [Pseudomonadota bacterium]